MKTTTFEVHTGRTPVVFDITRDCDQFARESSGGADGLLHVFVPHATAGVAILELGAGSDADLLAALDDLLRRMTAGGMRTARAATAAPMCCPRSSRRTPACPLSAGG